MDSFQLDNSIKWTAALTAMRPSLPYLSCILPGPLLPLFLPKFVMRFVEEEFERFISSGNVRLQAALALLGVGVGLSAAIGFSVAGSNTSHPQAVIGVTSSAAAILILAGTAQLLLCVLWPAVSVSAQHRRRRIHSILQIAWLCAGVLVSTSSDVDGEGCDAAVTDYNTAESCSESVNADLVISAACLAVCVISTRSCVIQLLLMLIAYAVTNWLQAGFTGSAALRLTLFCATFVMLGAMNARRDLHTREHFTQLVQLRCSHQVLANHRERVIAIVKAAMPESVARRLSVQQSPTVACTIDASLRVVVCATGIADFGRHTTSHFMQDIVQTFHRLFTLLDEAVTVFGVEYAAATGDTYIVSSGLLQGTVPHPERCVRFALWQMQLEWGTPMHLHAIALEGPAVGSVIANRRYAVGGPSMEDAMRLLGVVSAGQVWCDSAVRNACINTLDVEFKEQSSTRRFFVAIAARASVAAVHEATEVTSPTVQVKSGEDIARAAFALVQRDDFSTIDVVAADWSNNDLAAPINYCLGRFTEPSFEKDYFDWACQRVRSGFATLELITGLFLFVVGIASAVDIGIHSSTRTIGAIAAVVIFMSSALTALIMALNARLSCVPCSTNSSSFLSAAIAGHTLVLASIMTTLFFSGQTIVSVDPHFLFFALMPDTMLSLCSPLSALAASFYALLVLMIPIVVSGVVEFGYGPEELVLVVYITFVTIAIGQYGPVNMRIQRLTMQKSERMLQNAQTCTRVLVDLVSRLVPTHVVDLGVQLVTEGPSFGASLPYHKGDLSAVGKLQALQTTRLPLEVTHAFSDLIALALRLNPDPSGTRHLTETLLTRSFVRQWEFVASMLVSGPSHSVLELIHAVGDTMLFAGPFAQENQGLCDAALEAVSFLQHLAMASEREGVAFTAVCTLEEAIGAFVGNHALRYLIFGPAPAQAEQLLRAVPFEANRGRGVAFATRAFVSLVEPDYGFDVLHRMVPLPNGQMALFPPGSLQPALASRFGKKQRWRLQYGGARELWPIILYPSQSLSFSPARNTAYNAEPAPPANPNSVGVVDLNSFASEPYGGLTTDDFTSLRQS